MAPRNEDMVEVKLIIYLLYIFYMSLIYLLYITKMQDQGINYKDIRWQ